MAKNLKWRPSSTWLRIHYKSSFCKTNELWRSNNPNKNPPQFQPHWNQPLKKKSSTQPLQKYIPPQKPSILPQPEKNNYITVTNPTHLNNQKIKIQKNHSKKPLKKTSPKQNHPTKPPVSPAAPASSPLPPPLRRRRRRAGRGAPRGLWGRRGSAAQLPGRSPVVRLELPGKWSGEKAFFRKRKEEMEKNPKKPGS